VEVVSVALVDGRAAEVRRLGSPTGRPVLYFHSPAGSGEELDGAAERAAGELDIELLTIVRRSLADYGEAGSFMATVASDTVLVAEALGLSSVSVLGWSGGGPYALAASDRLGPVARSVHLVSPLPLLTGSHAVPHPSDRLQQIAATSPTSSWVTAPGALRDYMALVAPWPFDVSSVAQPVTIWAPTEDEIVPPRLIDHLARQLPRVEIVHVHGSHDWITTTGRRSSNRSLTRSPAPPPMRRTMSPWRRLVAPVRRSA